jgi:hypothetical protein
VGYEGQPLLEPRVLFKEIARERAARRQALDLWTGTSRQAGKLIFLLARGLVKVAPGRLGRWLAGAPDRWADRAFVHLVNHAQRMLVRNLTEQAWQRAQLGTARSERARPRLRAALVENGRRAARSGRRCGCSRRSTNDVRRRDTRRPGIGCRHSWPGRARRSDGSTWRGWNGRWPASRRRRCTGAGTCGGCWNVTRRSWRGWVRS